MLISKLPSYAKSILPSVLLHHIMLLYVLIHRFFVDLYPTRDGHYLCITCSTMQTMTEIWLVDIASSHDHVTPRLVWARQEGLEYYVEHHNGIFYVLANSGDGWQVNDNKSVSL